MKNEETSPPNNAEDNENLVVAEKPALPVSLKKYVSEKNIVRLLFILVWTFIVLFMVQFMNQRSQPEEKTKFAVVDMSQFRKEASDIYGIEQVSSYTRKLMALYREKGYVVFDVKAVVTLPENIEVIRPKYSVNDVDDALRQMGIEPEKYGRSKD